jgi:1-phosphofructokinase
MIATITLNPSIDQHILVPHLVKDDANRAQSLASYPGGKGVNVSKVIRELGGKTCAYTLIGGFAGDFWKQRVKTLDIRYSACPVKGETRINTIITDIFDKTQTRISAPGPNVKKTEIDFFLKKLLAVRPKPFLWALGGSLSMGMPENTYRLFVSALQKNGTPCILDADNQSLELGIRAKPFMIKPNEFEMQRLMNKKYETVEDYLRGAKKLVSDGVRIVVVSLAARGALFVNKNQAFLIEGIDVPVKSRVGAGDSLIGGLAFGLSNKKTLKDSAKLGIAASTSAVMREAPRLCLKADIPPLLKRIKIRDF